MVGHPSPPPSGEARLRQLVEAGIRINAERSLDAVLQAVVDAEVLELSHRALLYKLKEYGIDADDEGEKGEG